MSADPREIAKFDALAQDWWNPNGAMKPLHLLNPLRLRFIQQHVDLNHKRLLDIGCGGGLLSEAAARSGCDVTGIDLSASLLAVAREHAEQQSLTITYHQISAADWAAQSPGIYDVITCMELLEHVPDPDALVRECAQLLKPGGFVFFATLNRNWQSFLKAIIGAEYILKLLPKGTHQYAKFIRPSELTTWARQNGLRLKGLQGLNYHPFSEKFIFSQDVSVNYLIYFEK